MADVDQLVQAIRAVADGGSVIDPAVVDALVDARSKAEQRPPTADARGSTRCSPRSHRARATAPSPPRSCLSERAVEKHINSIFSKLGLTEEPHTNRRVKAVLMLLAADQGV